MTALCLTRGTDCSAMEYHSVAEVVGFLGREDSSQLCFHFCGILGSVSETQTSGDADAVSVCYDRAGAPVVEPATEL